jgi:hypothetical protein
MSASANFDFSNFTDTQWAYDDFPQHLKDYLHTKYPGIQVSDEVLNKALRAVTFGFFSTLLEQSFKLAQDWQQSYVDEEAIGSTLFYMCDADVVDDVSILGKSLSDSYYLKKVRGSQSDRMEEPSQQQSQRTSYSSDTHQSLQLQNPDENPEALEIDGEDSDGSGGMSPRMLADFRRAKSTQPQDSQPRFTEFETFEGSTPFSWISDESDEVVTCQSQQENRLSVDVSEVLNSPMISSDPMSQVTNTVEGMEGVEEDSDGSGGMSPRMLAQFRWAKSTQVELQADQPMLQQSSSQFKSSTIDFED